jgi:hypothetical protein
MKPLPLHISDNQLLDFIDEWVSLLEREDYEAAYHHTDHNQAMHWTPELIREVIKAYDEGLSDQKVTLKGIATDITQHKEVNRSANSGKAYLGEIWYDLNINGKVSDLTATFDLRQTQEGIIVRLNDIHVM